MEELDIIGRMEYIPSDMRDIIDIFKWLYGTRYHRSSDVIDDDTDYIRLVLYRNAVYAHSVLKPMLQWIVKRWRMFIYKHIAGMMLIPCGNNQIGTEPLLSVRQFHQYLHKFSYFYYPLKNAPDDPLGKNSYREIVDIDNIKNGINDLLPICAYTLYRVSVLMERLLHEYDYDRVGLHPRHCIYFRYDVDIICG